MAKPIVIAHHLIWTAYGWWLGNDPRGSTSKSIRVDVLKDLGELHYGRKQVQPAGEVIAAFYEEAAALLRHNLVLFDENDRQLIGDAIGEVIARERYTCWACAIMPDHVHLVIRKHKHRAEQMIANFQEESRLRLRVYNRRPAKHPVWGGPGWKVFLDHPDEVWQRIPYVEANPRKWYEGPLPDQHWSFVVSYDGWPLHPGHSPKSPYVIRLKAAGRYP